MYQHSSKKHIERPPFSIVMWLCFFHFRFLHLVNSPKKLHPVCQLPRRILIIGVRTFINPGWHEEIRLQCTNCSAASQVQLRKNPWVFQQASFCWSSDWRSSWHFSSYVSHGGERCGSKVAMFFGFFDFLHTISRNSCSRYRYVHIYIYYITYIYIIFIYVYHQKFGINTIFVERLQHMNMDTLHFAGLGHLWCRPGGHSTHHLWLTLSQRHSTNDGSLSSGQSTWRGVPTDKLWTKVSLQQRWIRVKIIEHFSQTFSKITKQSGFEMNVPSIWANEIEIIFLPFVAKRISCSHFPE